MIHVKFPSSGAYAPCECGVKMAYECKARPEMCGVEKAPVHTPYEFLHDSYPYEGAESQRYQELLKERKPPVDLDKICRETVEDLVKDSRTEQVGGTHYSEMSIQPWDSMRAWMEPEEYCGYHVGTVLGYLSRHKKKGGLQDIKKSLHHLSELVRYFEDEEEYPW